ncbi:hypothetical protein M378DRAFT_167119 [Amanita muscaria Koide BX008]|uniref:Mid2 domain-containing protein n=1 Tax=Amanita muscaria (strain Koide BX008) TaxID=946122 RepID=A0A0C2WIF7_AMAMK|nr:hypothetical protein M378DRAFT_167119 [Amanita muscaria Koide BX008]
MPGKTANGDKGNGKTTTKPAPIAPQTPVTPTFTHLLTPAQSATSSQSSQTTSSATSSPTTTTVDNQSNNSSNLSAITGGVVGGIFALIAIVLLLWFARQGRKKILHRRTTKALWSPSSTSLYHRPLSLPPSMQSIRTMHPVIESPFEEEHGQKPHLQFSENGYPQQGYY